MEFDLITGSSDEGKMGSLSFVQSNKKKSTLLTLGQKILFVTQKNVADMMEWDFDHNC